MKTAMNDRAEVPPEVLSRARLNAPPAPALVAMHRTSRPARGPDRSAAKQFPVESYFPTQNREKRVSRTSSVVTTPMRSSSAATAPPR